MDKKISLEGIWNKYKEFTKGPNLPGMVDLDYFKPIVNIMICEGISQALELAAENAKIIDDPNSYCGNTGSEYPADQIISKQSILDIINQIE